MGDWYYSGVPTKWARFLNVALQDPRLNDLQKQRAKVVARHGWLVACMTLLIVVVSLKLGLGLLIAIEDPHEMKVIATSTSPSGKVTAHIVASRDDESAFSLGRVIISTNEWPASKSVLYRFTHYRDGDWPQLVWVDYDELMVIPPEGDNRGLLRSKVIRLRDRRVGVHYRGGLDDSSDL